MSKQFRKHKLWVATAGGFFILAAIIALIRYSQSRNETLNQQLDTPSLIQLAYDRAEITDQERLLYLAYALFEHESLPHRFRGNEGWFGESVLGELEEAANSPAIFCSMSPYIRSEFQRLLEPETLCTQNQASQKWETPVLIGQAYDKGEITNEERLLYLAYALWEYESLPLRFRSNYGWFGEQYVMELQEALTPDRVCSMSPYVRSEFQRLFELDTTCERSLLSPVLAGVLVLAILLAFHFWKQKSQKSSGRSNQSEAR